MLQSTGLIELKRNTPPEPEIAESTHPVVLNAAMHLLNLFMFGVLASKLAILSEVIDFLFAEVGAPLQAAIQILYTFFILYCLQNSKEILWPIILFLVASTFIEQRFEQQPIEFFWIAVAACGILYSINFIFFWVSYTQNPGSHIQEE